MDDDRTLVQAVDRLTDTLEDRLDRLENGLLTLVEALEERPVTDLTELVEHMSTIAWNVPFISDYLREHTDAGKLDLAHQRLNEEKASKTYYKYYARAQRKRTKKVRLVANRGSDFDETGLDEDEIGTPLFNGPEHTAIMPHEDMLRYMCLQGALNASMSPAFSGTASDHIGKEALAISKKYGYSV